MDELDLGATIKGFNAGQKVFGRYTLARILGRGGMGVVWLARDEELEREVALKFLPEVVAMDKDAIKELKRETRRSLELTHTNIIRIYDFIQDVQTAAISMEYVAGDTLASLRSDLPRGCYEPQEIAPWVAQLCQALDFAHGKAQIVHRDLKPANLMVDSRGDLKVADFGIAASVSDSVTRVSKQVGSSGTPVYMSPQQMMGERPAITDDIYALGATLHDLLTGKPPFHSGNIILQVQSKAPPSVAERRKEFGLEAGPIPPEWEQTIAACLAKEAKDRPHSAGEVAGRLGLSPGFATKGAKPEETPRANPPAIAQAAASKPGESRTEVGLSRMPRPASKAPLYAGLAAVVMALTGLGYYFGIHAPEQKRLAEIARLEADGRAAEALKLKNEQERAAAEVKARQEREVAEAKAKAEEERLAAERLAAARGGIVVRTNPSGAEVRVGAVALEKSPLTLKDQKLGKYPVKIRLAGYDDWSGEVEVKENEFSDLDVNLVRSMGTLVISTLPANLQVEVTPIGAAGGEPPADRQTVRTPGSLKLPVGRYSVTFRRDRWPEQSRSVEVVRGQEVMATAEFAAGALELDSLPSRAEVWRGGERVGTTPYREAEVAPGDYSFELKQQGYMIASAKLTATAGQATRQSITLTKGNPEVQVVRQAWNRYREIVDRIQLRIRERRYESINDAATIKLMDQHVREISKLLLKLVPANTVLFYDLPLSTTSSTEATEASRKWHAQDTDRADHWVIANTINLFIAWRQEAVYFVVVMNHKKDTDKLLTTVQAGEEIMRKLEGW